MTMASMQDGSFVAMWINVSPPPLKPIALTRGISSCRSRAVMSSAACRKENRPEGLVDRPWPRRSGAISRKPAGGVAKMCFQSAPAPHVAVQPEQRLPLADDFAVQFRAVDLEE